MGVPFVRRLIVGGLALLFLSIALSLYSIVQLGALGDAARAALDHDHRMISSQEELTDAFLSEFRYSGKYVISRKEDRYEQLRQFKNDFIRHLTELQSVAQTDRATLLLAKIEQIHGQYHKLFDQEVAYIRANQGYAQSRYEQEREKLLEAGLKELERLKAELRAGLHAKLETMDRSARTVRAITLTATLIVALLGIFLALKINGCVSVTVQENDPRNEAGPVKASA